MEKSYNDIINEHLYFDRQENGLEVYYVPKHGFEKSYAILGVDFGSNDLEFSLGEGKIINVNEGIAHFLEHKMFEQPDESNAFDKFSEFGASANAFTGFNMTAYLFSTTDNFYKSLDHLISYVQTPHYTEENVEKEKGIIAQEIKMYEDNPDWQVYSNCLKAMYSKNNIRIDVAGSVDSIYKITPDELYSCYNTFYNPLNMKLFIVGDLDEEEIMKTVKGANKAKPLNEKINRYNKAEPMEISKKKIEVRAHVSMPMFFIGYKDFSYKLAVENQLKNEIVSDLLFDIIFSESGDLHFKLYNEGLIFGNFSGGYVSNKDYSHVLLSGAAKDPEKVKFEVDKYIQKLRKTGIKEDVFERTKRGKIGGFLKSFDSVSFLANNFLSYKFRGLNFLDYLEVLRDVELEDINLRLEELFLEKYSVISIVKPMKDEEVGFE